MENRKKSALLKTSAATDVRVSGGVVNITGLYPFRKKDVLAIKQILYKAEVVQVVTVGGGSYTPAASTVYKLKLINPAFAQQGNSMNCEKVYSYKTPADISELGATAALQREAIHVALVTDLNSDARNHVVAATLGTGTGFTVTDDAGYYPARVNGASNGRQGATSVLAVKNSDGSGWDHDTVVTITTAAVYGWGVGARLLQDVPVMANMTGNLISGELDAPVAPDGTYAVSGQRYNTFAIQSLTQSHIPTIGNGVVGYSIKEQAIFVDNGAGTDTTNATGYLAFEKEMLRLLFGCYESDPATIVDFFDNGAVAGSFAVASTGLPTVNGVPSGAAGDVNVLNTGKNVFHYAIIGTATAIVPILTASGLNLDQDATDNDGLELSPPVGANCPKQFVIGKDEFSLYARVAIADVSDAEFLHFGFRKKEAYQTADGGYATYTDLAALGFDAEDATQTIKVLTNLNDATSITSTSSGQTWADAAVKELEVRVLKDGSVRFYINGTDVTSVQATAFAFDSGDVVMPYVYHQLGTSSAPSVVISRYAVVGDAYWRL